MIERRQLLQLVPSALTSALVPDWGKAIGATRFNAAAPLSRGIFDERFSEGRRFGAALAAHGVNTSTIRGDVANLWYDDLRAQLRNVRSPIAGLTHRSALFCLEELARDVDMRIVTRVDHLIDDSGSVRHIASGSASTAQFLRPLHDREPFGQLAALLVLQREAQHGAQNDIAKRSGPAGPKDTTALATWVIA